MTIFLDLLIGIYNGVLLGYMFFIIFLPLIILVFALEFISFILLFPISLSKERNLREKSAQYIMYSNCNYAGSILIEYDYSIPYLLEMNRICKTYLYEKFTPKEVSLYPYVGKSKFEEMIDSIKVFLKNNYESNHINIKLPKILNLNYEMNDINLYYSNIFSKYPINYVNFLRDKEFEIYYNFILPFHIPALVKLDNINVLSFLNYIIENNITTASDAVQCRDSMKLDDTTKMYINELIFFIYGECHGEYLSPKLYKPILKELINLFSDIDNEIEKIKNMSNDEIIELVTDYGYRVDIILKHMFYLKHDIKNNRAVQMMYEADKNKILDKMEYFKKSTKYFKQKDIERIRHEFIDWLNCPDGFHPLITEEINNNNNKKNYNCGFRYIKEIIEESNKLLNELPDSPYTISLPMVKLKDGKYYRPISDNIWIVNEKQKVK